MTAEALYEELQCVSEDTLEMCYSPARWATEAVESALASRRLRGWRFNLTREEVLSRRNMLAQEREPENDDSGE